MNHFLITFFLLTGMSFSGMTQLSDGSIAPDFQLTDLDGNTHHLYEYLDQGKAVFLDFFACHCPSCWAYHNTGTMETMNQMYGPDGTDQMKILMIEYDEYNEDAFLGLGGYTQGDWTAGNSIPMINVEGADRSIFAAYNMTYYPMVYKICPDKTLELISTSLSPATLFTKADECPGTLDVEDVESGRVFFDAVKRQLHLEGFSPEAEVIISTATGQIVQSGRLPQTGVIDMDANDQGLYFVQIQNQGHNTVSKIFVGR